MKKYVFVTVGGPACGKSSFYHKVAEDNDWCMGDLPIYISSDEIREELFGTAYEQSQPELVFDIFRKRADIYLSNCQSVYLDATHIKKDWRKYAVTLAKKHDAVCVALYFDVPFWTLVKRDRKRDRHVGYKVLWKYFHDLEIPTLAEGFHAVFCVDRYGQYKEVDF